MSRRTVLRGLGAAVALPYLEAMAPLARAAKATASASTPPLRMAFFYVPNGVHMPDWTPAVVGTSFDFPEILRPLAPFREDMLVLSGLTQDNGRAKGDGPGDHARCLSSFLTGAHPRKTDGADIKVGVSVDQVAAQHLGAVTRLPSLELGLERGAQSGNCDSGYSCAYSSNISWRSESVPVPKEINPRLVFERLFASDLAGEAGEARHRRQSYRKSILDFVADDARRLQARLGQTDRRKVDEYLTSVRELESRIAVAGRESGRDGTPDGFVVPEGIPQDYQEHARLMADLLALAFQADVTRVATFLFANEGSNRSYNFLGVNEGHHELSHHGNDPKKHAKIKTINHFHITMFARFIERLKSTPEGNGSVLDHSMILYGSGLGDGNRHNHDDLPILLVGRGGGTIRTGRHVRYPRDTPLNNLYLSMLDRLGTPVDSLGDSSGRLPLLDGGWDGLLEPEPRQRRRHGG